MSKFITHEYATSLKTHSQAEQIWDSKINPYTYNQ